MTVRFHCDSYYYVYFAGSTALMVEIPGDKALEASNRRKYITGSPSVKVDADPVSRGFTHCAILIQLPRLAAFSEESLS